MDYKHLIQDLLALDVSDVNAVQRILTLLNDLTKTDTVNLLGKIRDLEKIVNTINTLNTTPSGTDPLSQRERFVNRVERLSESEALVVPLKGVNPADEPYFKQLDVIYCNFGGVGWEFDGPHYAIVWDDNHSEEELTVIPTTSKYSREYADEFKVYRITGLPPTDTVLSVKKIMRISRRRVMHHNGRYLQGKLLSAYKYRIEYAIGNAINLEKPLEYYVRNECGVALPANITVHYPGLRFMPVRDVTFDPTTMQLHFRQWDETAMRSLPMKFPNAFVKHAKKKQIYDNLFSNDPGKFLLGTTDYNALYP